MELIGDHIESEVAVHCADIRAILCDLHQSRSAAGIYLTNVYSGEGDNQIIRKALYESSVISLRRAFNDGRSTSHKYKRWQFPEGKYYEIIGSDKKQFKLIWDLASKCVAHRVLPESGQGKVIDSSTNFGAIVEVKFTEHVELLSTLILVTERFMEYLKSELEELRVKISLCDKS